jgi:hypothetical protein
MNVLTVYSRDIVGNVEHSVISTTIGCNGQLGKKSNGFVKANAFRTGKGLLLILGRGQIITKGGGNVEAGVRRFEDVNLF